MAKMISKLHRQYIDDNKFKKEFIKYSDLKPNQIVLFDYKAVDIHDPKPLIWVAEIRQSRMYGINLNYCPGLLNKIIKEKDKTFKKFIANNIQKMEIHASSYGLEISDINTPETRKELRDKINVFYKEFYDFPKTMLSYSYALRNYIPRNVLNIKKLIIQ